MKILVRFLLTPVFFGMGIMCLNAQSTNPDVNKYTLAIRHNANDEAAWYGRGTAYLKLGKYDLAISDFSQCVNLNAYNFKALTSRANTYFKLAQYDSAIADYTATLENEPDDKNDKALLVNRGDAYRLLRKYKASVVDYSDALGIDSTRDTIWYNRGIDYYKLCKYDSAINDFTKALTLHPSVPMFQIRLILALSSIGNYNQANFYYNDYVQKRLTGFIDAPEYGFVKSYINACANSIKNNDYKNALQLLLQSLSLYKQVSETDDKSDNIEYVNIVAKTGFVYEKLDSFATALQYYQKAQGINPNVQNVGAKIAGIDYVLKRNTIPPIIKLVTPAAAQTRGMLVESDKGTTRGIKIEADTNKDGSITVKGVASSPAGISQVKVNGNLVGLRNTDTTAEFETYISDTCTTLTIQAWNKQNIPSDAFFRVYTKQSKPSEDFVIPPISDNEKFHAIFIACTNYTGKWPSLDSTISEAERLKKELIDEYNFNPENIVSLYNKNKQDILKGIYQKLDNVGDDDNVLIFYGGHGYLDPQSNVAYWVPALANDRLDYISNSDITEALQNRQAKHILVMADACFSGAMRGMADDYVPTKFEYRQPSRQLLTSGAAETVPGVSVFIPNILEFLRFNNNRYYSVGNLYVDISKPVQIESGRTPIFRDFQGISNSGAGQFYFKKKLFDSVHVKTPEEIAQDKINAENAKLEYERKKQMRDSLIALGKIEKDREHLTEALNLFQKALAVNPDPYNTSAKNAVDQITKLVNLSPDDHYRLCVDSAVNNKENGKYGTALKWYNKAIEINPSKKDSIVPLRNALIERITFLEKMDGLFKTYQYKAAIKEYGKMLKNSPDKDYYIGQAKCYDALGPNYFTDALNALNLALALEPTYLPAIKTRAELNLKYGKTRDAITDYKIYVKIEDDPSIYMKLYKLHISKEIGAKDEAIEDLTGAIALNPRYTEAYFNRGIIYLEQSNYQKALDDFNEVLKLDPLPGLYYYYRGTCYINLSKMEDAAFDFKTARIRNLDSSYFKTIRGYADDINFLATEAAAKKQYESAIIYVTRAISIDPTSPVYRYQKGNYNFELKLYQEAIKNYDSAVYLKNDYQEAYFKRGVSYFNLNKYDNAITNFDKVLALNAADIPALQGKADSYFELGDYTNAAKVYEQAIKLIEDNKNSGVSESVKAKMNNNLGFAYYQLNLLDQSIKALSKSIKQDENFGLAYYNLGKAYEKNGVLDDAAVKIDKALSYDPNNAVWNYSGAGVYLQKNNFAKSAELYTKAIQNDSSQDLESAYYYRGYSYKKIGDYADAAKDYLTTLSINQDTAFPSFNNELGNVYYNLQNYDSAYIFFKKSFNKDSSDANALAAYGLAAVLFEQKKTDESLELFEKAFQSKSVSRDFVKADKNYAEFKNEKRFWSLYKKYY